MTSVASPPYYDPYDFDIDADPYPVWRRLRDEQPLYYNERYDFYALSRFEDVERSSIDFGTYSSARGTLLELIKSGFDMPPGTMIFEDPPTHDIHRGLLSRVFTPRKINALEPKVRELCARCLDPLVDSGRFDFVKDLGAQMPMRVIGMLLGIPEQEQTAIRDRINEGMRTTENAPMDLEAAIGEGRHPGDAFEQYIEWRVTHPSDDLMTELLRAEFDDASGTRRRLSRAEVLGFVNLIAAAGNETTTRLIGWAGKVLAENPEQRRALVHDRGLVANAIEELLRYESPSPVQARYVTTDVEHYERRVPAGSVMLLLTASANRDERKFPDADHFDVRRSIDHHLAFGYGVHFCLGAALARLEGRVALEEVLQRFPSWEVDWSNAQRAHTSTVRGWEQLPVITS